MPRLIDIGANLTHDAFDRDRVEVIRRAREAGVHRMIVTGSTVAHSRRAAQLASQMPEVLYATAGVHPHHAKDFTPEDIPVLADLAQLPGVVAVGECGLDHYRNYSTPEQQDLAFIAQLEVAAEVERPVFLHQRDAHERFVEILSDFIGELPRAVAHCFTGTARELRAYLDMGLYIGITGWVCDERRGKHLEALLRDIPPDRLLVETDAPYLLPRDLPYRVEGRRNEPMHLPHIVNRIAECLGRAPEEVAATTTENAERFFGLFPAPPEEVIAAAPGPARH